jgi:hypothetical protein
MLSSQEDQIERERVLRNDQRVREQTGTYLSQTHSELGGRFAIIDREIVTGRPSSEPPPLPSTSPWSGSQPEPGIEPPLGYRIDDLEPSTLPSVEVQRGPVEAPTTGSPGQLSTEHAAGPSPRSYRRLR